VTFVKPDGVRVVVSAPIGDSMLEVAHANKIDLEGACGGETACSTCHMYVDAAFFKKLPEMEEAEEDMLDLAAGLKDNSRLGCQVYAAKELEGMIVTLPAEVNNMKQE
jgi:2Fe-2S ferredoxin